MSARPGSIAVLSGSAAQATGRRSRMCQSCGQSLKGRRRGTRYCSDRCRDRARDNREREANAKLKRGMPQGPCMQSGGEPDLASDAPTAPKLIISNPRWAREGVDGFVLCAGCSGPTRQLPVVLEVPGTDILQVATVYCASCSVGLQEALITKKKATAATVAEEVRDDSAPISV